MVDLCERDTGFIIAIAHFGTRSTISHIYGEVLRSLSDSPGISHRPIKKAWKPIEDCDGDLDW